MHPVKKAIMRDKLRSMLTTMRVKMYLMNEGEDATDVLVELGSTVAVVAIGAYIALPQEPWVNQLRGALNTIQSMCLDKYRWNPLYAAPLNNAVDIAIAKLGSVPLDALAVGAEQGMLYAALIKSHQVTKETPAI